MSLFDFPRINIAGTVLLNPGTANNDDYAGAAFLPSGETLALMDSKQVQANTYGMSDEDFIAWVQQGQTFNMQGGGTQVIMPSEWNYYGDMSSSVGAGDAAVVGVVTGPGQLYTSPDPSVPATALIGSALTYDGGITDINSEGSPPATQFFIEQLTLMNGTSIALQGPASKGACQWINFYRNVNAVADQGAGGYMYHVILKSQCGGNFNIPGFDDPAIIGAIFRYYLYNIIQGATTTETLERLYANKQNPAVLQFVATIAPLYDNEAITTGPVGRLLAAPSTFNIPLTFNNGSGAIALAPAVVQQNGNTISVEFVGTFPDNYQPPNNNKYDLGVMTLTVTGNGVTADFAIDYTDTTDGNNRGWLYDFDISGNAEAQKALSDPNATFALVSEKFRTVLTESEYFVVTNQLAMYAEQNGAADLFLNQGTWEPATVSVYQRGVELAAGVCPPITVWSYSTVPLQTPGARVQVATNFQPGDPLNADTSQPGNLDFVFTVGNQPPPPASWSAFLNPPFTTLTNTTIISLRILPNGEDFSQYYVDPTAPEPVGNASLTFDVVYQKVLRVYYLLFPAMNQYIPLNDEAKMTAAAGRILARTDPAIWMSTGYMPRTRDMSATRRTLLQAWCRKVGPKPAS